MYKMTKIFRNTTLAFSTILVFILSGCGSEDSTYSPTSSTTPSPKAISVYITEDGTITGVRLGDSAPLKISSADEYADVVEYWVVNSEDTEAPITLEMKDAEELEIPNFQATATPAGIYVKIPKTDIGVRVDFHRHFIGSCIQRYNVWHANLACNYYRGSKQGREITNIHLPVWKDGKNICAGIYVTPQEYCRQACGNLKDAKKKAVQTTASALSAYVSVTVATAVAEAIVPIVFAASL